MRWGEVGLVVPGEVVGSVERSLQLHVAVPELEGRRRQPYSGYLLGEGGTCALGPLLKREMMGCPGKST